MSDYDVKININDAFRYLGGQGEPDKESGPALRKAAEEIQKAIHPRCVMKICDIDRRNGLSLAGTCLELTGKAIDALLHDSRQCAIFCATLGAETDSLIRQWQIRDLAFATMLDACGSTAVESLCDIINDELKSNTPLKAFISPIDSVPATVIFLSDSSAIFALYWIQGEKSACQSARAG